jgi:DNA repair protein RadD
MQLRDYQRESVARTVAALSEPGCNPLVVLPTGAGKSLVIGALVKELLKPTERIVVLAHRKELLLQNAAAIARVYPEANVSIYSHSAGSKDLSGDVIVAGIASIANVPIEKLPGIGYIFIDEAHLVSNADTGQFRSFIQKLNAESGVAVIGFSATPFRMKGGYLHQAKDGIFTKLAHEVSVSTLIDGGYLAPFVNKSSVVRVDLSNLASSPDDFVQREYDPLYNNDKMVSEAVLDIISYSQGRNSWLLFCSSVEHAHKVCAELMKHQVNVAVIDGKTPQEERDLYIQHFKSGKIKAICNCDVLTVGFDAPNVDLIALLRPTKSPGLYVQMIGRGARLSPGKENCLVLDYGQNIERFGPIDKLRLRQSFGKVESETIPLKVCPDCREVISSSDKVCLRCGYEFPVIVRKSSKHSTKASEHSVLRHSLIRQKFDGAQVLQVVKHSVMPHYKAGKPPSVRVDYHLNMLDKVSEWLCPEHTGYAKVKTINWWQFHTGNDALPETAANLIKVVKDIELASKIVVTLDNDFPRIVKRFYKNGPLGGANFE